MAEKVQNSAAPKKKFTKSAEQSTNPCVISPIILIAHPCYTNIAGMRVIYNCYDFKAGLSCTIRYTRVPGAFFKYVKPFL